MAKSRNYGGLVLLHRITRWPDRPIVLTRSPDRSDPITRFPYTLLNGTNASFTGVLDRLQSLCVGHVGAGLGAASAIAGDEFQDGHGLDGLLDSLSRCLRRASLL